MAGQAAVLAPAEAVAARESKAMPAKQGQGITPTLAIIIAASSLASSVIGGYIGSATTSAQWKGEITTKIEYIEKQRLEDREAAQRREAYWQAQNEAIGKQLAKIEALASVGTRR